VWTSGGQWWMLYTGRDKQEQRRMGLACHWSGRFEEALAHFDAALLSLSRMVS